MKRLLILAAWLLASPLTTLAEDAPPKEDLSGVYVFAGPGGWNQYDVCPHILRINKNKFEVTRVLEGTVSGKVWQQGVKENEMSMSYFDGHTTRIAACTVAVTDGHLWLGAMRPVGKPEAKIWESKLSGQAIFGAAAEAMPTGSWQWLEQENTFVYRGENPNKAANMKFPCARLLDFNIDNPNPNAAPFAGFYPVFTRTDEANRFAMEAWPKSSRDSGWNYGIGPGMAAHFGFLADPKLVENGIDNAAAESIVKAIMNNKPAIDRFYRRMNNCILPPWAADLGPVGIEPVKLEPREAIGEFACESDKSRVVTITEPPKGPAQLSVEQSNAMRIGALESMIAWKPDENGIVVKSYAANCMMNHGDFPGYIIWIPLSPTRAACYTQPATHSRLHAGIEFFKRIEKANP